MRLPRVGFRLGLRGVAGIIALLAVLLAVSRPFWREPLEFAAAWVWADFYRHDIVRHVEKGRSAAERFIEAIRSLQTTQAYVETSSSFRRRIDPRKLTDFIASRPILQGSCTLTGGVIRREYEGMVSE